MTNKPLVIVRWNDADSSSIKILTETEQDYHKPVEMQTVGWLLKKDKKGVSVVNEVFQENGVPQYRGHTFVPHGMVISIETVRKASR